MIITEITMIPPCERDRSVLAYPTIVLDNSLVVRDMKIIDGKQGPFVAMPSRRIADRCLTCGCKNHLMARFCNGCGIEFEPQELPRQIHTDVCFPCVTELRQHIQEKVMEAYNQKR